MACWLAPTAALCTSTHGPRRKSTSTICKAGKKNRHGQARFHARQHRLDQQEDHVGRRREGRVARGMIARPPAALPLQPGVRDRRDRSRENGSENHLRFRGQGRANRRCLRGAPGRRLDLYWERSRAIESLRSQPRSSPAAPWENSCVCRNIRTLFNFDPPVTDEEVRAASLQFVRKIQRLHPSRRRPTSQPSWPRSTKSPASRPGFSTSLETNAPPIRIGKKRLKKPNSGAAERFGD